MSEGRHQKIRSLEIRREILTNEARQAKISGWIDRLKGLTDQEYIEAVTSGKNLFPE